MLSKKGISSFINYLAIKNILFILVLVISQSAFTQPALVGKQERRDSFYFYYAIVGLGSNLGGFFPTLRINNNQFYYTEEQHSYLGKKDTTKKTISQGIIPQGAIDSVIDLVKGLKDTTIKKINPCIFGGVILIMIIARGTDTTKFNLYNTFDSTAIKIANVLNPYLPPNKQIVGSISEISEEEDCMGLFKNKEKQGQDSSKIKH